ncbi:MAG: hypothetical protein AB7U05_13125 [Mangrovibacterium sp.]
MTQAKLILIILTSLLTSNLVKAQQIQKFESSLGKERTAVINEIVSDFEKYLDSTFSGNSIGLKYDKYLESISKESFSRKWKIDDKKMIKYKKLELFDEYLNVHADSVWYDGEFVNWSYCGEIVESIIPINGISPDSIAKEVENELHTVWLVEGRFYIALETIDQENPLVDGLLDFRLATTDKTHRHTLNSIEWYADELHKAKLDYTDYFVKRIIAIGTHESE